MTHAATGGHTPTTENAANAAAAAFEHYPLYCYHLSPTITQWCPLRARDIHELAQRRGFEGQDDTFFHLNHPIRWVRVVGVVVAVDQYYGRRVYTIDDGSGACIECVTTVPITTKKPEEAVAATAAAAAAPEETKDPYADIDVGLVVDARGGLALYRQQKQVRVTRLRRLASTAAETAFWHKIRAFAADVLARPWVVDARVRRRLEKEARRDVVGGGGGGGGVDSDARRRQRSRRDRDDQERNNNDGDDAKAARKRRRHHRDEEERESVRGGGDGGDDDDAGARKKLEDRQRRKERHTGNNETSNGIPPRTGSSLRDEARKERRAGDDATSNNIPSRTGNSLHDEARQRRKDRPTPTGNNERPNGIPPRTGNSLLDESRRRRREKAEKLRESSQPVASSGKYSALGL